MQSRFTRKWLKRSPVLWGELLQLLSVGERLPAASKHPRGRGRIQPPRRRSGNAA